MGEILQNTTLVIAGHGSSRNPNMTKPAREHAKRIQAKQIFADVKVAFWKEAPNLNEVLDQITTKNIVIVPNLACSGHINKVVIPREMKLNGDISVRENGQVVYLCDPVGDHEGLPTLFADQLKKIMVRNEMREMETTVFLVAHGNPNPERPASHDNTVMMATRIYQQIPLKAILPAFIEEKPFLYSWRKRVQTKDVVVLPFMIAAGTHGAKDIPEFLGIDPEIVDFDAMMDEGSIAGPFEREDCKLWLMPAIGSHPRISDFITEIALNCLKNNVL